MKIAFIFKKKKRIHHQIFTKIPFSGSIFGKEKIISGLPEIQEIVKIDQDNGNKDCLYKIRVIIFNLYNQTELKYWKIIECKSRGG